MQVTQERFLGRRAFGALLFCQGIKLLASMLRFSPFWFPCFCPSVPQVALQHRRDNIWKQWPTPVSIPEAQGQCWHLSLCYTEIHSPGFKAPIAPVRLYTWRLRERPA